MMERSNEEQETNNTWKTAIPSGEWVELQKEAVARKLDGEELLARDAAKAEQ